MAIANTRQATRVTKIAITKAVAVGIGDVSFNP
jgi:hypothetical protein